MGFIQYLSALLWLFGLFCLISNTDAQSQTKRSSRITSSRTSFGTNVKSSSSPSSNGVNFDCPEEFGYYPHPTDCTQYYVCVFGGALLESCTGGLMYSHELQTCDWPRNVGCEVVDSGERDSRRKPIQQQQQQQQQINQHVPNRIRFGSAFTGSQQQTPAPQQIHAATVPPQYHRQPQQIIQAQVQTLPPPPELKVPPNPVVTSRGQPKHLLDAQEEIAKLYADAQESLPPVEEEESDRQQRVYRGQPSTVSQVQKDRDGIIHQASINAIPNNDKFSSYSFGTQYRTDIMDLDLLNNGLENVYVIDKNDLDLNVHKRNRRDLGLVKELKEKTITNDQQVQSAVVAEEQTNKSNDLKITKYSSKFSSNTDDTLIEIKNLVAELYGPEYQTSSTDDLMELMQTKVSNELKISKEILAQQKAIAVAEENASSLENSKLFNPEVKKGYDTERQLLNSNGAVIGALKILENSSDSPSFEYSSAANVSRDLKTPNKSQIIEGDTATEESFSVRNTLKKTSDHKNATKITESENSPSVYHLDKHFLESDTKDGEKVLNTKMVTESYLETQTEILTFSRDPEDLEYMDTGDNNAAESVRTIRQLRPYTVGSRSQWLGNQPRNQAGSNYRSLDSNPFQQQVAYSFGAFNPYLTPPSTPTYAPLNSVNSQYKPNNYPQNFAQSDYNNKQQKPKVVYTGYNLSLPPPKAVTSEDDFRPIVGKYYPAGSSSTTLRPAFLKNTDLLPYILKSLQDLKEQRKKMQVENFSYFHLDNQPKDRTTLRPVMEHKVTTQKATPNSHFSQISTVGGFYNNKHLEQQPQQTYQTHIHNPYINQGDGFLPSTTESSYFKYNFIANQKMKNYYSTLKTPSSTYELTTLSPVTSNFKVINPPKLVVQHGNYVDFDKFSNGITYANTSLAISDSYQAYVNSLTSTTRAPSSKVSSTTWQTSTKSPIKLQFNLPDFISNLQTKDMAHLNPAVVDMLKYFKEVNKPLESSKVQANNIKSKPSNLNFNEIEQRPSTTTKRPIKGYENFLNSLSKPATIKTTTSQPSTATLNAEEYYDEYEEEEEENEGIDADDDIQPPSEMPPYMPMTETMAPPRSQMMPQQTATDVPSKYLQNYNTGFYQATTTRRPLFTPNFEQFYQPQNTNSQNNPNQIPSFINFPSDYFQEIQQKLPPLKGNKKTSQKTVQTNENLGSTTRLTSTVPTSTVASTTARPTTSTTTTLKPQRYTIRPNRFRGQNKWQPSTTTTISTTLNNSSINTNKKNAIKTLTLDLKQKPLAHKKRPTSLASSNTGINSGTGSNNNFIVNQNGQINNNHNNNNNRIESSSPSPSSSIQSTPATIFIQSPRPTTQQHNHQHKQQQQQQVIVETIPSTQTQNRNHQQLSPPLPTLAQPQPFSQNRNYYNTSSSYNDYNNNNNNNNQNNHNVDVVSYIPQQHQQQAPQQQQQIPLQHSSQNQNQQQSLIPQQNDNVQQSEQSPYDTYYSVYDDDIDLYRDIEYQQQQQQQQHRQQPQQQQQYQQPIRHQQQQSTYRPLDIFTTPSPQTALRETYKPQPKPQERPTYQSNQQPLVYNTDYDEDLIAQIEQDNAYDQPTRQSPTRKEQVSIQTLSSGPSSTERTLIDGNDERNYYNTLTTPLPPPLNFNGAYEPTYVYETEYVDEPDYYYEEKIGSPQRPTVTTFKPNADNIFINNNNKNHDENNNVIDEQLQNTNDVDKKPKNRINTRPATSPSSSSFQTTARTTKPTTTLRTTSSTTTTTKTTPKPSTTKLSKTTSPSSTTTKSSGSSYHKSLSKVHLKVEDYNFKQEDDNEQIIFNIGIFKTHYNNNNKTNNENALFKQQQQQLQLLQLINSKPPPKSLEQPQQHQHLQQFLPLIKVNKTEKFILTLLTDNVDFSNRSKQTHVNKKLQQEQLFQQQKSQQPQKHLRHEITSTTQSHTTTLSSTTAKTTTLIPTTYKPKIPFKNPLTIVTAPEKPSSRLLTQTQTRSRQVHNNVRARPEKDPIVQSLEDIETVYDESQNVHVQSAEPPKSRGLGTQYISASNDKGVYLAENYSVTSPRGNLVRSQNDQFKTKSYDIYGGLKSNEFVEDQKSRNSKDSSTRNKIKNYVISDEAPQSFKPPSTEKNLVVKPDSQEDIEILNEASSSTTLRYPGSFKNFTEEKPFQYSLQTGKTGFTLRAQHLGLAEENSQPLYERRPAIQYFTKPHETTPAKTTTTTTSTTTTTTEIPTTTSTTTERLQLKPQTEIDYVESYYDDIQPTTYAPPLRTWRNGRPTIQTTAATTTLQPRSQYLSDYSYRLPTEASKLQTVAKEYLPRSISTTSTTTTTTTPRTTTTTPTTTTTTSTTTPRTTTTVFTSTERPMQTFTARASIFKDNLQKTTIASNLHFVSPYKSLETLLQKEERSSYSSGRSTVKPKHLPFTSTAHPFLQTTSKPGKSYFLITSPPRNLNETLYATMVSNNRNFSISDALIGNVKPYHKTAVSTTTTATSPSTELPTFFPENSTPSTLSTIVNTSPLRINLHQRNEGSEKPRARGRSRYTAATVTNLLDNDEPTTYSPKKRFKPSDVEITTTPQTPTLQGRRKIQRARIAALQNQRNSPVQAPKTREKLHTFKEEFKKHYENEAIEQQPRAEALIAGPVNNNQDNSIESNKSTETIEQEQVVAITDRPLKYYYSNKYRQQTGERTLAESLHNAGYITSATKSGNSKFKSASVLEQLQLFLAGTDSDENESSSPQFVQDFFEPEINAAVEEIKNLYATTGQRPSWTTTTTTTTLRPTTTAKPHTTALTTPSTTQTNLNSIHYTSTYSTTSSPFNYTTQTQMSFTSPTTSTTNTTTTTPKYFPKFPSSTYSFLTSSSSSSTTTSTTTTSTTTPPAFAYSSHINKASSGGVAAQSSPLANLPPARVSRVNNALKSSIAAAATASPSSSSLSGNGNNAGHSSTFSSSSNSAAAGRSNKFSLGSTVKCSDTTSNAKCNEIPTRINSNSNRNRGSASSSFQGDRDTGSAAVTSNRGTHPPRTRPTLKPSGTIVSKAQEFIDIYRNPPSRPDPLYPTPQPDKTAAKCRKDVCLLPDCSCGGRDIPGDLNVEEVPQIVLITFDDAVSTLNIDYYNEIFNNETRRNPNGCPIRGTFYVSHEWTDYGMVQDLYADGHEMASHTVSHSFGEQFSQKKWNREISGQREILAAYGGVKLSDVRGMRAPFLSVGGNKMYKMLYDSNFTYDSSMPVYENRPPSWPYTLDYKIFHDCMIPPCPTKSYPGVWQVPMVMWQDLNGGRCSMGDACSNPSESEAVTKMIMKNFERHYTTNRAPFGLFYHAAWFTQPHHKEGFIKFLDAINAMPDVWIVTNWQALQWVRDPTPISRINSFQPFQCDYSDRPKRCNNPKVCNLWHKSGVRYMKTCQPCPDIYPWTGKTGIRSSRIDNEIEDSTA